MCACGHPVYDAEPRARCAPARSISRGCRPSAVTALLSSSHTAPARLGDARSSNYRAVPCCLAQQHAAARNLCPRTLLASVAPATRGQRRPAVGRPGRTQPPCGRDRTRRRRIPVGPGHPAGCGRPRPGLLGTPTSGARCRPPRGALSLAPKRVRTEVPSGLALRTSAAAGNATRKRIVTVPRIPGRQPECLGRQRHRRIHHASGVYQQVSLSVTASV